MSSLRVRSLAVYMPACLLGLALSQAALAQQPAPPAAPQVPPAAPAAPAPVDPARLQAAQERLEAAAREVAELSMQMGGPAMDRMQVMRIAGPGRAIIGVQLAPQSGKEGARVDGVSPGGPAAEAGLKPGDVIVSIDGNDLRGKENGSREMIERMAKVVADAKVRLKVQRAGKVQDFEVVARRTPMSIGSMNAYPGMPGSAPRVRVQTRVHGGPGEGHAGDVITVAPSMAMPMDGAMGPFFEAFMPGGGIAGLELANLTPKLGQYFGTEKGVLVLKAPAENKLKLEEGDVILAIDGREPSNASHATRILRSYQPGEKVNLRIQRQRKAQTLEGIVPERRKHSGPGVRMGVIEDFDIDESDVEFSDNNDGRKVEKRRIIIRDGQRPEAKT
jgi:S1-C subfamily serine protease